jgi:hypothetical protein
MKTEALRSPIVVATLAASMLAFSGGVLAQTPGASDISGTWVESSNESIKWVFDPKDDKMHVQKMNGDTVVADFTCTLSGQECGVKEDGRPEKIMIYYNGPQLIAIRERGNDVLKQRISVSSDGKTLQVETVPLSGSQKSETVTFQRQVASSNNK